MVDVIVIGAGVVGLAVTEALAARGATVTTLEAADRIGEGISSRNSEVIHAGIYYPAGSLKATLCVDGRERLATFCARHRIAHRWTGKVLVATADDELPALEQLAKQAKANGSRPLVPMDASEVCARWPAVRGVAALWSTGTGIVDGHAFMARLRVQAERKGAAVLCRHRWLGATRRSDGWQVTVRQPDGSLTCAMADLVINAAGLYADVVARTVCADADLPRHVPIKGSYFDIAAPAPADTLVYPVPSLALTGLGTHLTVDLAGRARLGPDVEPATSVEDFAVDPTRAVLFHRAAMRFLPGLRLDQLRPAYAGVRPKLAIDRVADFYIRHEQERGLPGWVNLLGIESPGLTAALAIGHHVANLVLT
ncbi:MAG: NAD(P)/FAD-dependent oxidoreductase [Deltaproteobacteria bacterium]|nr:NAD(P)/FAD-dependent oxidoreductase [Deltaproteobacteria bacterium]